MCVYFLGTSIETGICSVNVLGTVSVNCVVAMVYSLSEATKIGVHIIHILGIRKWLLYLIKIYHVAV